MFNKQQLPEYQTKRSGLTSFEIAIYSALIIGLVYMFVTGLGGTKTFWGWDARKAGWGWKIVMFIPVAVIAFIVYLRRNKGLSAGHAVLFGLLLGLGFASSTGFKFTGGDIGQRVSAFNNEGKVIHPEVLFDNYTEFYHLDTDTALVRYIKEYQELPGRNLHNALILGGDIPPSTAPRANEDFKWHSHRDNSIYKRGE